MTAVDTPVRTSSIPASPFSRPSSRPIRFLLAMVVLVTGLAGVPGERVGAGSGQAVATPAHEEICSTGRLRVGQLPELTDPWAIAIEADRSLALEWRPDAVLVATDLGCGFLTDEPRIRTTFFSADARGLWDPETAQLRPLDPGDPAPKAFADQEVSWTVIHDALIRFGLEESDEIGASGLTVRLNTAQPQFGPSDIPPETIVVHLTVGNGAATRDIYVDAVTGDTYTFE